MAGAIEHSAAKPAGALAHGEPIMPMCPRCGYDLAGAVASWHESCPLEMVCSECGLRFHCCEVMNPVLAIKTGMFEHAQRRRMGALVRTAWRAQRPLRFWDSVRMSHEVRPATMAIGVVVGLLLTHLVWMAMAMVIAVAWAVVMEAAAGNRARPDDFLEMLLISAEAMVWPIGDYEWFLLGGRVGAPVFPALAVGLLAGALMPAAFLLLPATFRRSRVRRVHLVRIWAYSWIGMVPVLVWLGLVKLLADVWSWHFWSHHRFLDPVTQYMHAVWLGLMLLWMLVWWGAAAGRYLKLPRPWAVAAAMVMISGLLSVLVVLGVAGPMLLDDLGLP